MFVCVCGSGLSHAVGCVSASTVADTLCMTSSSAAPPPSSLASVLSNSGGLLSPPPFRPSVGNMTHADSPNAVKWCHSCQTFSFFFLFLPRSAVAPALKDACLGLQLFFSAVASPSSSPAKRLETFLLSHNLFSDVFCKFSSLPLPCRPGLYLSFPLMQMQSGRVLNVAQAQNPFK